MPWEWVCAGGVVTAAVAFGLLARSVTRAEAAGLAALSALRCPRCDTLFGDRAVALRAAAREHVRALLDDAKARGVRLRLDGRWRFECCDCRVPLVFDPTTRTLAPSTDASRPAA
jgi:uncharacterized C2H2 Zn-finger protein